MSASHGGLARLPIRPLPTMDTMSTDTGYPWVDGDILYADDLNAAFLPIEGGTVTGPVTMTGPHDVTRDVAFTPSTGGTIGIAITSSVSGTMGAVGGVAPFEILIPNNSLDSTGNPGSSFFAQTIQHNFGATRGSHGCINMIMQQTANVLDSGTSVFINPLFSQLYCNYSGGGAGNAIAQAGMVIVGGPGWGLVEGSEIGVSLNAGANVLEAFVETYIWNGAVRATRYDAMQAYAVGTASATAPRAIWQLGRDGDAWPVDANGWLMTTVQPGNPGGIAIRPQAAAGGFDFWRVNFATAALRSSGVSIESTAVKVGTGLIGEDSNGMTINAVGAVGSIGSILNPGNGYHVGDQLYDTLGGIIQVNAVGGAGNVTNAAYITGKSPYVLGSGAPSDIAAQGGSGQGDFAVHLIWTPKNVLSMQQGGGLTVFGGPTNHNGGLGVFDKPSLTSKPTVTGAKGGNTALASLLTTLVNYGLIADGTT